MSFSPLILVFLLCRPFVASLPSPLGSEGTLRPQDIVTQQAPSLHPRDDNDVPAAAASSSLQPSSSSSSSSTFSATREAPTQHTPGSGDEPTDSNITSHDQHQDEQYALNTTTQTDSPPPFNLNLTLLNYQTADPSSSTSSTELLWHIALVLPSLIQSVFLLKLWFTQSHAQSPSRSQTFTGRSKRKNRKKKEKSWKMRQRQRRCGQWMNLGDEVSDDVRYNSSRDDFGKGTDGVF